MLNRPLRPLALGAALVLAACSAGGSADPLAGFGPDPKLPPPSRSAVPQVAIAKRVGWAANETPRAPGRPLGWYAGAGPVWTFTDGFSTSSRGLGAYGEAGLALDLGARWRVRVGAEFRAFESDVARNVAADDGQDRWVYTVSPVVFLQFDL